MPIAARTLSDVPFINPAITAIGLINIMAVANVPTVLGNKKVPTTAKPINSPIPQKVKSPDQAPEITPNPAKNPRRLPTMSPTC